MSQWLGKSHSIYNRTLLYPSFPPAHPPAHLNLLVIQQPWIHEPYRPRHLRQSSSTLPIHLGSESTATTAPFESDSKSMFQEQQPLILTALLMRHACYALAMHVGKPEQYWEKLSKPFKASVVGVQKVSCGPNYSFRSMKMLQLSWRDLQKSLDGNKVVTLALLPYYSWSRIFLTRKCWWKSW